MKTIQYSEILKQALIMTWENKFMWFFGLLVFLGSLVSSINMNFGSITEKSEQIQFLKNLVQAYPAASFATGLIFIALLITFFLLKFIAIAGIIKSTNNIAVYRQSKIKAIFYEVKRYLWALLLLEIMINIAIFAIVMVLFIPVAYLFVLKANIFAISSFIIASLIVMSVAAIAYYLRKYAYFYMILGNIKIRLALEHAYHLLQKNIRGSLIMGLLAIVLGISALATVFVLMMMVVIIISPFGLIAYFVFAKAGAVTILIAGIIIEVIIFIFLLSVYASFSQILWVLFFQEISLEKQEKKLAVLKMETETQVPTPETV